MFTIDSDEKLAYRMHDFGKRRQIQTLRLVCMARQQHKVKFPSSIGASTFCKV